MRYHRIDGERVAFTPEEEVARDAEEAQWEADKPIRDLDAVQNNRRREFPPVGDMVDAFAKALDGDRADFDALQVSRNATKQKYPKICKP